MNKVVVQMLVGQNKEPFLEYAVASVDWADRFVVVQTSDNEIAEQNIAIISQELPKEKWTYDSITSDQNGHFSFADARNKALEHVYDGDYVFLVDADDLHYPEFEQIVRDAIEKGVDSITAYFYHLMVYKDIYQYTAPRQIVFKKYSDTTFAKGVHEQLITPTLWPITAHGYKYLHYGYVKSQKEVFKRWKFYSDLEGDYTHYDGQSPDHILDDRISVCKPLDIDPPHVIEDYHNRLPKCPLDLLRYNEEAVPVERVGLILLTYNDEDRIEQCLHSLYKSGRYPDFRVLLIDNNSTDSTVQKALPLLKEGDELLQAKDYSSLAESLNAGLDYFRVRHDIQYIGWIHPDMSFPDPYWLYQLWQVLQDYPKIGKICAANTRDSIPDQLIEGHEQCYIMRKDVVNKVGLFDEGFKGIGGYEDWCYNRRILNHNGYKVMLTPKAKVYHEGMGTRSKRDTTVDQVHNSEYYFKKYGTYDPPV